ncbi:odorant receptor coreceptor-like [Schistocerca nitens]|uniref:odorant receptor coreceptor-like n=1 Tax=Schistocerca nitens TaxID=7011 RepID=UPI002118B42F|nr:odorant receptor coreceptor-like [Schistocerca nitens]
MGLVLQFAGRLYPQKDDRARRLVPQMEAEAKSLLGPSGAALQQLGVWRPPATGPAGPRLLSALFIIATNALVSAASAVQLIIDTPTDSETLRDVFFQTTCGCAWALRMVLFMQQRARLGRLVLTLLDTRKRYAERVPGIRSRYDRSAAVVFLAWQVLPLTSVSLWALGPVTGAPESVTVGNSTMVVRREPLVLWLPLDTQQSPTYEIVFALQVVGVVAVSEISILLDIFFVCLMIHVMAEIAVLNKNVTSIRLFGQNGHRNQLHEARDVTAAGRQRYNDGEQYTDGDESVEWTSAVTEPLPNSTFVSSQDVDDAKRRLYAILKMNIQHHQAIMLCVTELEEGMSKSTYIILLVNALTICLHAFGFVELFQGGWKGPAVVKRLLACPIYMAQTALFCLFGQSLTDHSERLLDSAFSCGWPGTDGRFCSALLIFMQQASQPLKIRVGKIFTLSRNSFLQVCKILSEIT